MSDFDYLIVGGGEAANAAANGIRELDTTGSIGIVSADVDEPYDRTALTKALWLDPAVTEETISEKTAATTGATILLNHVVTEISRDDHQVVLADGERIGYGKLLIATGSVPTQLHGASGDRFIAMRSLANYRRLRELVSADATAIVVGGGFIGTEIAAALAANGVAVTLIFPQEVLGSAVFPAVVADRFQTAYLDHGVTLVPGRLADHAVVGADGRPGVVLDDGSEYYASVVVAGLSAKPDLRLGSDAGLEVNRGIVVDEHLKTSDPVIWAAGDIAEYPDVILGRTRIEHVDHAQTSGATAGRSMAGSEEIYDHTPFFWSDAFEIGWEAIGRLDARLDTEVVDLGEGRYVVYYLDDKSRPVGVLLWGVWDSVDKARQILAEAPTDRAELRGRIV